MHATEGVRCASALGLLLVTRIPHMRLEVHPRHD